MSICIDCKKGANECEWLFRLRPVRGWSAKKVRNNGFVTYDIESCPNFEQNRPNVRRRRTKRELLAVARLMENDIAVSEMAGRGA